LTFFRGSRKTSGTKNLQQNKTSSLLMKTKSTLQTPRILTRNAILLVITALALSTSPASRADALCNCETIWTGTTGDWFNPSNWSTQVPTCSGGICPPLSGPVEAQINNGGTAQITTPTPAASVCQLFFGYNTSSESGKVSVDHGTLNMCNEIFVGYHGKGVLSITNGGVVSTRPVGASIASLTGSNGTVTVDGQNQDGTKSQWTVGGAIYLGGTINSAGGIGLLSVTNSATVTATSVHVYPSGTLTGNSTVSTTNGMTVEGTISRTVGTLTIGGDLTFAGSAAAMQCSVTPQDLNQVDVSVLATATLTGRLSVTMTGNFTPGTRFTLLHTAAGRGNTFFSSVSITYPTGQGFTPVITYDANNVYLYLTPNTGP
jgi:T5SS/PEP-CTERM-associated repeat protein